MALIRQAKLTWSAAVPPRTHGAMEQNGTWLGSKFSGNHEARLKRLEDHRSWIGPAQFPVLGDEQLEWGSPRNELELARLGG